MDAHTEAPEKEAQLLDVRLARRVTNFGDSVRSGGRKDRRFGAGDRRFKQIDRRRMQAVGRFELKARAFQLTRTERRQRLDMRCERAARRKIAAWRREARPPSSREQWTGQQDRSAQASDERGVRIVFHQIAASHPQRGRSQAVDLRSKIGQQSCHLLDVPNERNVREHAFFGRQQARGEQRKGGVLVPLHFNLSEQSMPALYQ